VRDALSNWADQESYLKLQDLISRLCTVLGVEFRTKAWFLDSLLQGRVGIREFVLSLGIECRHRIDLVILLPYKYRGVFSCDAFEEIYKS
jgi:hypothetical protein